MDLELHPVRAEEIPAVCAICNSAIRAGDSLPWEEAFTADAFGALASEQTACICAVSGGQPAGFYILHPNFTGRSSHIANASYAVAPSMRGRGIGEALVRDSLERAARAGFRSLQFNAVVATNAAAIRLYEKLGFRRIGTIQGGYRSVSGQYLDMYLYDHTLIGG